MFHPVNATLSQPASGCPELPKPATLAGALLRTDQTAVRMRAGEILNLREPVIVRVVNGAIWLTGTPAREDIFLRAGERFCLERHFPFVMEALETTEIVLE